MYRVAICDDSTVQLHTVEQAVRHYFENRPGLDGEYRVFTDPRELKHRTLQGTFYDVYLLGVCMLGLDGIALGHIIREKSAEVPIIYFSHTKDYAYEAFSVHAFQYLLTPINEAVIADLLDQICLLDKRPKGNMLELKCPDGIVTVEKDNIMYIENHVRTATYTMAGGKTVSCTRQEGTFEEAVATVARDARFIQPHKSYFVNMEFIDRFTEECITMKDEKMIPVNYRRLAGVRRQFTHFFSQPSAKQNSVKSME